MVRSRGPLRVWICTVCSVFLIISHVAPQISCQTRTLSSSLEDNHELAHTTRGCNQRGPNQLAHEHGDGDQHARNNRQRMGQQLQQQHQLSKLPLELMNRAENDKQQQQQQIYAANARKQRQYNLLQQQHQLTAGRSAAMIMSNAQQQLDNSNQPAQQISPQPEEFSLAAGAQLNTPAAGDLQPSANSAQQNLLVPAPADQHNLTVNSYTMVSGAQEPPDSSIPSPSPTTTTATNSPTTTASSTSASEREPSLESRPTSGSLALPTGSEEAATQNVNTTPQLPSDSLSSPVGAQPPATTTTSSNALGGPSNKSQQQQSAGRQQQARRMDNGSNSAAERHSSGAHSISSSPSSVSIITPLMGPPQQQQQPTSSSSSMMKPIYVVGNPIGEMDYTSISYEQQQNKATNRAPISSGPRAEKRVDEQQQDLAGVNFQMQQQQQQLDQQATKQPATVLNATLFNGDPMSLAAERLNGPALVYSEGRLVGVPHSDTSSAQVANVSQPQPQPQAQANAVQNNELQTSNQQPQQQVSVAPLEPRLFQAGVQANGAALLNNNPRRPSLPPPVNQEKAASGFRSPLSPSGPLIGQPVVSPGASQPLVSNSILQQPANSQLPMMPPMPPMPPMNSFYQASPPYGGNSAQLFAANMANQQRQAQLQQQQQQDSLMSNKQALVLANQQQPSSVGAQFQLMQQQAQLPPQASISQQAGQVALAGSNGTNYQSRRPLNITRVEHISAECSNDLIRAVIVFNGTFKGIIYSSGYVNDPTCLYVNGSGLTRYEFSIRLNQCGTLGRQEMHQPAIPGEAKRRDQVMWNTLSIQYNSVIEQEWDEHFRVSCEYGSDFWKTISFSPFNVETNTGSPVVFTINPPQCQMDVLLGHGMGPKIAVDGPVTVGDPLTLLIHMKSEKAGYDILVKNCVAHNGGKQRMQLIDVNGCVVNERFISPFRGFHNDNDLRHVTLYAYLKAFRFTGSPVLYLECEIHMCQSACPPQMCYWRRLSKRSVDNTDFEYTDERSANSTFANSTAEQPIISDSLSLFKALQVRHEPVEPARGRQRAQALQEIYAEDEEAQLVCYRHAEVFVFMATLGSLFLLVLCLAITCFLRLRSLTQRNYKRQFEHSRLTAGSLSPSLLSISEPLSNSGTGSVLSSGASAFDWAPGRKQQANRGAGLPQHNASRGHQQYSFNLSQSHHSPGSFGAYDR